MGHLNSPEKQWAKQRRSVILDSGARIASAKGVRTVDVYEIALHLQQDLIEAREKPAKVRKSAESKFIQKVLGAWGYELSKEELQRLAARATSYESFILSATK